MNLLHLDTGRTWRGGQAQVTHLVNNLSDLGVDNHLLVPPASPLTDRFADVPSVVVHTHPLRGDWDLSAPWYLSQLQDREAFDVWHAHSSGALAVGWLGSYLLADPPPLAETRRLETPVAQNPLSRLKYGSVTRHIANSRTVKNALVESGIDASRITVIPSGINLETIRATEPDNRLARSLGLDPNRPIVGNVGALCPQKDQTTFVRTARELCDQRPELQFVIAGDGELREDLDSLIETLELRDTVVLAGFVENVIGLMKTFDVFVLTSRYEGLCGTLMQAMASGVPVVTSKVEGSAEIIHDGDTCLAVDPGDVHGFSRAILTVLNDHTLRDGLVETARRTVERYDYPQLAERTLQLYQTLAEGRDNVSIT